MSPLLNSILNRWMAHAPIELPRLNCDHCTKSQKSQGAEAQRWADWKCCTFQPFIPNFALGKILSEGGKLPTLRWDHQFLPIGLVAGAKYREAYSSKPDEERGEDFRCAFYSQSKCSIWSSRPSECSTYFCEDRTQAIEDVSNRAFRVEAGMSQLALLQFGFTEDDVSMQVDALNAEIDLDGLDLVTATELYTQCWQWASQLSADTIQAALEEM